MIRIRALVALLLLPPLAGCWIEIQVPTGGRVVADSGRYQCAEGSTCSIEVDDKLFDETFTAIPNDDQVFDGWEKSHKYFCGGGKKPCHLFTSAFGDNQGLLDFLSGDDLFFLVPRFRPAKYYQLQGRIQVGANSIADSDVNDENAPYTPNDSPEDAQAIPNPVNVGGYANLAGEGDPGPSTDFGDEDDYFEIELIAGQLITLTIAEPETGDLDLFLLDENGTIIDFSLDPGFFEQLTAPATGRFFVNVWAWTGASNYTLAVGQGTLGQSSGFTAQSELVPGEAIVRYHSNTKAASQAAPGQGTAGDSPQLTPLSLAGAASVSGNKSLATGGSSGKWLFKDDALHQKWLTLMQIKALNRDPGVDYAEPNYIHHHFAVSPDDEYYSLQQHYKQINLPEAWEETTGSSGVIVAVIDTGVLLNHPDLQGQLVGGYDFISDPQIAGDGDGIDPNPDDVGDGSFLESSSFHGTHVAGTIAAASDNGIGVSGVAWKSKIMPLRVLGRNGGTTYDILQALRFAAGLTNDSFELPPERADIINMSLGGTRHSQAMQDSIFEARNNGLIVVAAAGNESTNLASYPAAYHGVLSVGAVGPTNQITGYSNFGRSLDLVAPGGDLQTDVDGDGFGDGVLSTSADDSDSSIQYTLDFKQGTSMAAPHVAGVIALMKAQNPNLDAEMVDQLLAGGELSIDLGDRGRDDLYGHGIIDARKAVLAAANAGQPGSNPIPVLNVVPSELSLGSGAADLFISNSGTGQLQVTNVTANDNWLRVSALDVDGGGLGRYSVEIIAGILAPGVYEGSIRVESSSGSTEIPVLAYLQQQGQAASTGVVYVLLVNEQGNAVETQLVDPENGQYQYRFDQVKEGRYLVIAGSDMDNDFYICDPGEACGAYTTIAYPLELKLNKNKSDINFSIGFDATFNSSAQVATDPKSAPRSHGLRRPRPTAPVSGVRRQ